MMRFSFLFPILLLLTGASTAFAGAAEDAGYLGISLDYREDRAVNEGRMVVAKVFPDSPAKETLRQGDVISRVNGVAFRFPDWNATMTSGGPFAWLGKGEKVRLLVQRDGKDLEIELVAALPPPEVIAARRSLHEKLQMQNGSKVFDRLAAAGAEVRIAKAKGGALVASADGLTPEDGEALARYFSGTRLRTLFTKVEEGGSLRLRLGLKADTQDGTIEVLPEKSGV